MFRIFMYDVERVSFTICDTLVDDFCLCITLFYYSMQSFMYRKVTEVELVKPFFKQFNDDISHRNTILKRNFFMYAKFLQWFSRHLSSFTLFYKNKLCAHKLNLTVDDPVKDKTINSRRRHVCLLFVTSRHTPFLTNLACNMSAAIPAFCFHLTWDPLFFFYSYSKVREKIPEFFPLLFIDPALLRDPVFYKNASLLFFGKYPVFLVGGLNEFVHSNYIKTITHANNVYPLIVSSGNGIYWFLFWLRFLIKLY